VRVVLTTHVNADGDGAGSEVALWHFLTRLGVRPAIANPTPFPDRYRFLLDGAEGADQTKSAVKRLKQADAVVVLDFSDLGRLGHLARVVEGLRVPVACVDHHQSDGTLPPGPRMVDAGACATGELIYDLARTLGWTIEGGAARALYVAMLTDTGGFRFSNMTPRTLQIAGDLLQRGVNPEDVYEQVYASESPGKVMQLAETLQSLVVEEESKLAWLTIPPGALERHGVDPADLDGVVEFARSISPMDRNDTLFRQLASGRIKVSFRSMGEIDVARLAETFGGGGHRKAAGASLEGTLEDVQRTVLTAARSVAPA